MLYERSSELMRSEMVESRKQGMNMLQALLNVTFNAEWSSQKTHPLLSIMAPGDVIHQLALSIFTACRGKFFAKEHFIFIFFHHANNKKVRRCNGPFLC